MKWTLKPHVKTNSKWIKDPSIRPKTLKLLEEKLCDTGLGSELLDTTGYLGCLVLFIKSMATKIKRDTKDYIKI